jgi:hypothetical protein
MRAVPLIESFQPNSWPSQGLLAQLLRVSRQSVNVTVGQLRASGLYVVDHRLKASGGNGTCHYRRADLDDDDTRAGVSRWYRDNFPDTSAARSEAEPLSTPEVDSAPLSTPEVDRGCQPLDLTGAVNPSGLQGLSTPEVDMNRQANSQRNAQHEGGAAPGLDLVCASLRADVRASGIADLFCRWLTFKCGAGNPLSESQQRALWRDLSKFSADELAGPTDRAIAGAFRTIYTDRIKRNGKRSITGREFQEPDYGQLIARVVVAPTKRSDDVSA